MGRSSSAIVADREKVVINGTTGTPPAASTKQASLLGVAIPAAATLAVAMGIGRFVYTPILPLMEDQAGLTASMASNLASANYLGYLLGALIGIFIPALAHSAVVARWSMAVVIATLALMPVSQHAGAWFVLRLVAGIGSALLFVIASSAIVARQQRQPKARAGWGFGGVGLGIALSGVVVLLLKSWSNWRGAWWGAAVLAAALAVVAWRLVPEPATPVQSPQRRGELPATRPWFGALLASYTLEGVGYIIAGTFLVAAINENSPGWLGSSSWIAVGIAAVPAAAMWANLARRRSRSTLLLLALAIQAVSIALPALANGVAPAIISAVLFGNTFMAISSLAVAIGAHLQLARSIAILTTGYSVGQFVGPLVVKPLLGSGYHSALLVGAAVVLAAAGCAALLRVRFPHRVGDLVEPSRQDLA